MEERYHSSFTENSRFFNCILDGPIPCPLRHGWFPDPNDSRSPSEVWSSRAHCPERNILFRQSRREGDIRSIYQSHQSTYIRQLSSRCLLNAQKGAASGTSKIYESCLLFQSSCQSGECHSGQSEGAIRRD